MFDTKFIRSFQTRYEMIPNGCWEWFGPFDKDGYGKINRLGKTYRAHRVSYMIHKGEIPGNQMLLHSCDNPKCVNPAHLSPGTAQDNNEDMIRKGRRRIVSGVNVQRGSRNVQSKLTAAAVLRIRHRASQGESNTKLAREFEVSEATIGSVVNRRSWRHI